MQVLGVIPARGGSKSVPRKNLQRVSGRPLIAYVIDAAKNLLESWSGRDFGLGEDVRAVLLGGLKSLHIDDALELDMVRFFMKKKAGET